MGQNSITFSSEPPKTPEKSKKGWKKSDFEKATHILVGLENNYFTAEKSFLEKWLPEYFIQELLQNRPIDPEMNTRYMTPEVRLGWKKTLRSFGIGKNNSQSDTIDAMKSYERNYVRYIGKKLLIPSEQYEKMDRNEIDKEMRPYLQNAIELCKDFHRDMQIPEDFKSKSYNTIHEAKNVYDLLDLYSSTYDAYRRGMIGEYKITPDGIKRLNFAMFEITRILVILKNLLMWEQSPGNHLLEEDATFLVRKILSLSVNNISHLSNKELYMSDDPLYLGTNTLTYLWKKQGKGYDIIDMNNEEGDEDDDIEEVRVDGYNKIILESITLQGKYRDVDTAKESINVLHIGFRGLKNGKRGVEKRQRKGLISMEEVLDKKGFQFVVEKPDDKLRLIKLLENELSTLRSGWLEIPEEVNNPHTDPDYHCMKGTLLVPHKHKHTKEALLTKIDDIGFNDDEIDLFKKIIKRPAYTMPVEIQIFTLEEYIKAEYDTDSKVYHGNYVQKQRIGLIPIWYPASIYGKGSIENISTIRDYIEKRVNSTINKIFSPTTL